MADYKRLKELVEECIKDGLVKKKMTVEDLRKVYKERTKEMRCYDIDRNNPTNCWGAGGRSNERQIDFFNECAKQVYSLPNWPKEGVGKNIQRAQKLGVGIDDLPFIDEAKAAGELENYLKVCCLPKKRHLPLRFYLDLIGSDVRQLKDFCETPAYLGTLYAAARQYAVTGHEIAAALKRWDRYRIDGTILESYLGTLHLEDEAFLLHFLEKTPIAYDLSETGIISLTFGARYRYKLDKSWHAYSKITDNPLFDQQPTNIALALYRGRTAQELASNRNFSYRAIELTKKEAAEWLATAPDKGGNKMSPARFLCEKLGLDPMILDKFRNYSRTILLWYSRKKDLPSMSKKRVVYGPGGHTKTFCFNDILDEIAEEDLGPAEASLAEKLNANPERVFEAASKRLEALYLSQLGASVELPAFSEHVAPMDGVQQLLTSHDLVNEGRRMKHCVGGYVKACINKISYVFSVTTEAGNSTFEVCYNDGYYLAQHHGYMNQPAPEANRKLVQVWCKANGVRRNRHQELRHAA